MTEQITIRQETQDDHREVFEINHIAFGQDNESKLVDALRKNQTAFVPELSIFKSVIVLGHEHYYPKFGFQPADKWNLKSPFDIPSNVFMAIELISDGLKNISGTVVYPKEFENV